MPTTPHPNDAELDAFAADPTQWGEPEEVLTGDAAADYGRAVLESAGVDVDALDQRMGRPRLGPGAVGTRSPRVNASITPEMDADLTALQAKTGKDRSALVREAIKQYLPNAS